MNSLNMSDVSKTDYASLTADEIAEFSESVTMYGQSLLPEDPKGIEAGDNLWAAPVGDTGNSIDKAVNEIPIGVFKSYPWWDTVWKWTKCIVAVAVAFIPVIRSYKAIKALGGVIKTVKLLWNVGNIVDFIRIGKNVILEILVVIALQEYCLS